MHTLFIVTLLLAVAACFAGSVPFELCSSNFNFEVKNIDRTPVNEFHRGQIVNATITGQLKNTVKSAKLQNSVYKLGVKVSSDTFDICKVVSCPIAPGKISVKLPGQKVPDLTPPGEYTTEHILVDDAGVINSCVKLKFTVKLL
ncbi:phosphatidylglycerol/phosphatidylinositol transfer protein [Acrasis kona]|uniref:Phosphatidylglycerol/phosphatidylinositol transfer protein n=1 Tax=Acrasis kona TaxID=1008807 RepID=A0AAW2YMW6_9EUKA